MIDDFDTLDGGIARTGLTLSPTDNGNLLAAAKWGRFISIVAFVFLGLGLISMLFSFSELSMLLSLGGMGGFGSVYLLFVILTIGISFFIVLMLFQFSSNAIKAVNSGSQTALTDSFRALKTYMAIFGVITAIYVALIVFVFLFSIIAAI